MLRLRLLVLLGWEVRRLLLLLVLLLLVLLLLLLLLLLLVLLELELLLLLGGCGRHLWTGRHSILVLRGTAPLPSRRVFGRD